MGNKCGRQVGDKCKFMRPKISRVGDPRYPEWETRVGDEWETKVKLCGPRHPEWETSVGNKGGDKWKLMRPKEPREGDKCGR